MTDWSSQCACKPKETQHTLAMVRFGLNSVGKFMDIMTFSHHPSLPSNPLRTRNITAPLTKELQDSWENVRLSQEGPAPASLH